jgi:hypothetical protein
MILSVIHLFGYQYQGQQDDDTDKADDYTHGQRTPYHEANPKRQKGTSDCS